MNSTIYNIPIGMRRLLKWHTRDEREILRAIAEANRKRLEDLEDDGDIIEICDDDLDFDDDEEIFGS